MDVNISKFRVLSSPKWLGLVFATLAFTCLKNSVVLAADENGNAVSFSPLCAADLTAVLPPLYNNLPNIVCKPVWNTYTLRYSRTQDNLLTIILSATYTTGWVGIGFSNDGMMLNSSAMVGWINENGVARIKQYYLGGFTPSDVKPDNGNLPLTSTVQPFVTVSNSTIYLAFQLKFTASSSLNRQAIILAFATKNPSQNRLTPHNDKASILFDFTSGNVNSVSTSGASMPYDIVGTIRTHGVLGLVGWGLILPIGTIVARYFRHLDTLWFYLHVFIQFVGFVVGVAAVIVGKSLYDQLHANIPTHRNIGIFVLALTILQVLAFLLRPHKESKTRSYWNMYHHWVGRMALFFGALNIVFGIQASNGGNEWKIGYALVLGIILVLCIVLEALLNKRRRSMGSSSP